jgi:hypothetical protein
VRDVIERHIDQDRLARPPALEAEERRTLVGDHADYTGLGRDGGACDVPGLRDSGIKRSLVNELAGRFDRGPCIV